MSAPLRRMSSLSVSRRSTVAALASAVALAVTASGVPDANAAASMCTEVQCHAEPPRPARSYWIGVVSKRPRRPRRRRRLHPAQPRQGRAARAHAPRRRPRYYSPRTDLSGWRAAAGVHGHRPRRATATSSRPTADGMKPFRARVEYLPARRRPSSRCSTRPVVHPQQGALGRRVPLRLPARAGGGFRAHRRGHGPRLRARFRRARRRLDVAAPPRYRRRSSFDSGAGGRDGRHGHGGVSTQAGQGRRPHGVHARPPADAARAGARHRSARRPSCARRTARSSRSSNGSRRRRSTPRTPIPRSASCGRATRVLRLRHAGRPRGSPQDVPAFELVDALIRRPTRPVLTSRLFRERRDACCPRRAPSTRGAMMIAAVCWSTGGLLVRQLSITNAWEIVFWRSLFMALFVAGCSLSCTAARMPRAVAPSAARAWSPARSSPARSSSSSARSRARPSPIPSC